MEARKEFILRGDTVELRMLWLEKQREGKLKCSGQDWVRKMKERDERKQIEFVELVGRNSKVLRK